jgi:hypothetical protein
MIKKFEYSRTHVEEVAWKDWRALAIAEANDTTSGWKIETSQTGDFLMQTPGHNTAANVYPFKSSTRVAVEPT